MRKKWLRAFGFGLATAGLLSAGMARADGPIEGALPSSTIGLIKVKDAEALRKAFGASQTGQLLADPAMEQVKERVREIFEKPSAQLKQAVGVSIEELLDLPQGPISIAIVAMPDAEVPVALLISADAGENAQQMAEVMKRATAEAEKAGAKVAVEGEFHIIKSGEEDAPPLVWVSEGSVYRIGSDLDALKELIANADGREDSLASGGNYKAVVQELGEDSQAFWYLDLKQAIALATSAAAENGGNARQVAEQLQGLGINYLQAVGGSLAYNVGEYDSVSKIYIHAPGAPQGIFKLFPMPAVDLTPQPWVPEGAATYQSLSWDLDAAWDGLTGLLDQYAPGVLDQVKQGLAGPNGEGIDIERDVIGPLGDRITIVTDFKKPITEKSQRVLLAIALEDGAAFQETLNKVFQLVGSNPDSRTFQGATIYDFDIPAEFSDQAGLTGPISLTIAKDTLFVSSEPSLLEQVLRPDGPALADSDEYRAVAKYYPESGTTRTYERPEEQARAFYSMLQSGQLQQALEMAAANDPDAPDFGKVLDPAILPDFDVVKKYLAPSGGFGAMSSNGASFTQFTIKKAQP